MDDFKTETIDHLKSNVDDVNTSMIERPKNNMGDKGTFTIVVLAGLGWDGG